MSSNICVRALKPNSFDGEEVSAGRTYYDSDMEEQVDIYDLRPGWSGSGCQADFYLNNASEDDEEEFALKLFFMKEEALQAFQLQRLLSDLNLAPPVHRMVKLVYRDDEYGTGINIRWGYQTCVASMDTDCRGLNINCQEEEYEDYCYDIRSRQEEIVEAAEALNCLVGNEVDIDDLLRDEGVHDDDILSYRDWLHDNGYDSDYLDLLEEASEVSGSVQSPWGPIGRTTNFHGIRDLHGLNVGYWKDSFVIIDCGRHAIGEG